MTVIRGSLGTLSGLRDHIRIVEGQFPDSENGSDGESLEVLISQNMAAETGFKVGDVYQFVASEGWFRQSDVLGEVPVKIAGIWEAINPEESYWISAPDHYKNMLYRCEKDSTNCSRLPFRYDLDHLPHGYLELDEQGGEIKVFIENELIYTYSSAPQCHMEGCSLTNE
jgi:hypothetical protein